MGTQGLILGNKAPDFCLKNQNGNSVSLRDLLSKGTTLLAFYPGDFRLVCTEQLCNYRDNLDKFKEYGVHIAGISDNPPDAHAEFAKQFGFEFELLSDPGKAVAKTYGCTSLLMFGGISRAIFVVNKTGHAVYRYVEPTVLTRRKAGELLEALRALKERGII